MVERNGVTKEEFIKAWQESKSTKEVSEKLNMKIASVYSRKKMLLKHGVPLKAYSGQRITESQIEQLRQYAKSLL